MLRSRMGLLLVLALPLALPGTGAGESGRTMSFRWEGGYSPYRSVTVAIASDGTASCEIDYLGERSRSELALTPQEIACFAPQFRRVVALDRQAIEVMAEDTGLTTWRMTEGGQTRELSYVHTQNPWAAELFREMWRFVERETARLRLGQGSAQARYQAAYKVLSDLRQERVFHPQDLRRPLLDLARQWPPPGLSPHNSRESISRLLEALAHCEPAEQWAGDATELLAGKGRDSRIVMLRAMVSLSFSSDLSERHRRLLVPVMLEGLDEVLADPNLAEDKEARRSCVALVESLGHLRDGRVAEVLSSDRVRSLTGRDTAVGR
jgi:hypothetical protein